MHVSVQIDLKAARLLHAHRADPRGAAGGRGSAGGRGGGDSPGRAEALPEDLAALAKSIQPVHPGVDDDDLKTFFMAEVGSAEEAARLIERLRRSPHVTAAYLKPSDEPPM